jgi:hypothetical protein
MTVAERVRSGGPAPTGTLGEALSPTAHLAFSYTGVEDNDDGATRELVALYRELVAAVRRLRALKAAPSRPASK